MCWICDEFFKGYFRTYLIYIDIFILLYCLVMYGGNNNELQ